MKKRAFSVIGILLAALLMMTACGSSTGNAGYRAERKDASSSTAEAPAYYSEEEAMEPEYAAGSAAESEEPGENGGSAYTADQDSAGTGLTNDKLVYTCNLEIETTEYAKTVQAIREKIRQYNAIIEYESENDEDYNWYYSGHVKRSGTMSLNLTVRVPAAQYDAFVTDAGDFGKVTSRSQNVENISRTYHSTEARIEALTKEEARLTEMMDKADTIEEMIYIEKRLTEVEAELNANKTNLASMDVDVAYSTVNLRVREVMVYTEEQKPAVTFGQRIKQAFSESWEGFTGFLEGFLIVIIHLLPFIVCGLVLAAVIVLANRAADKKHPERKERRLRKKEEKKAAKERAKAMKMNRGYPQRPIPGPANPPMPKEPVKSVEEKEKENTAGENK